MNRKQPFFVFWALVLSSLIASISSYKSAQQYVSADMQQALELTLLEQPKHVITPDTIQSFNGHLQIAELRGKAYLQVGMQQRELQLEAHCPTVTILTMSDQRPAMALASMALIWILAFGFRPHRADNNKLTFGQLTLSDGRFFDAAMREVKFTPMQYQLMELFFVAPDHRLSKEEICDALWPKKEDPNETLYTLIRRLKPVLEAHSRLHIVSERGRAYTLTDSQLS